MILPLQRPALLAALLLVVIMAAGDFIIPCDGRPEGAHLHAAEPDLAELELRSRRGRGLPRRSRCCWWSSGCCASISSGARCRAAAATRSLGGKGAGPTLFPLGRLRYPLGALALLFALSSSVIPLLAVGSMAFMRYWSPYALKPENLTLRNFQLRAVRISAGLALGAAQPAS